MNSDGSFSYTPAAGLSGSDTFTYRASDAIATSAVATVSVVVVPTAPTSLDRQPGAQRGPWHWQQTNTNAQGIADPQPLAAPATSSRNIDSIFSDRRGRSWQLHGEHHDRDIAEEVASGVSARSHLDAIDAVYANLNRRGRRA